MKTKNTFGKRILSLVLTVLLVLSLIPMSVFSAFAEELSEAAEGLTGLSATIDTGDTIALKDADGDGYYDISNADELYAFAQLVNGGNLSINAELTANIVVNEGVMTSASTDVRYWTPIGGKDNEYEGTFDGNNKTISGLYFNDDTVDYVGLFGYANGTIKNTGVINSYFYGYNCVSAIIGYNYGEISNCYSTNEVNGIGQYTGGVVGFNRSRYITGCYNTGKVTGDMNVGGISGYSGGYIVNCYNTGKVTGDTNVGGVTGYSSVGVKNSYNTGTVSGGSSSQSLGGLIGFATNGRISSCYSTGTVSGGSYVYDLIGQDYNNNSTITNCYYLDTAGNLGINGVDTPGSVEAKTASSFASGEVAYLLQGEQEELVWGQKIGTDTVPVLGGDKVYYGYTSCDDADNTIGYTNTVTSEEAKPGHNFENGFCTVCDAFEPATDENNDGVYEISNAGQLYWFAEYVNAGNTSANAILTADIVVNENVLDTDGKLNSGTFLEWKGIGDKFNGPNLVGFYGTFDGNGKTISGIYTDFTSGGLFRENYGTIKNLNIVDSYFGGASFCGGENFGSIINCSSSATINNASNSNGGICKINKGLVEACAFTGKIFTASDPYYVGGICGMNSSVIKNCYSSASIEGTSYIGGISGTNKGTVENCYSTGKITIPKTTQGRVCYGIAEGTVVNSYYINTSMNSGSDAVAVSQAQFESGEVAYLLQGTQTEEIWGQKIGTDTAPVLGGDKVYSVTDCKGEAAGYNNTGNETLDHNFENGFCTVCDVFVPATDENEDGVFEIANAGQLYWFAEYVNAGNTSANAILIDNIVVNEGTVTESSTDARAWTPIGNNDYSYTGTFDGNNHTVSGLYFNNSEAQYVGLFGYIGENSEVKNTGVINSYFNGYYYVGGVAGENYYGTITNCYNTGFVSGFYEVGGVVGMNYGTITNCYNTGFVSGAYDVGGVVGYNYYGTITNCYNTGFVSGSSYYVGGVAGDNYYGTITNCYNTGEVSGVYYIGGVAGDSYYGTITNCYYLDTAYTGGIGLNNSPAADDVAGSAEAKTAEQFKSGEVAYLLQGTQEEDVWGQKIGTDEFPSLGGDKVYYGYVSCAEDATAVYTNDKNATDEKPDHNFVNGFCTVGGEFESATLNSQGFYEISNAGQLYWFAEYVNAGNTSANAILTDNIVVNEGVMTSASTDARAWTPIGNNSNKYAGTFDGNGKTVSGLYFNNSEAQYVGLFGVIGEDGEVKNIGVINSYFNADKCVGGVAGYNFGTVTNCYNAAEISADKLVGGIVGCSYGVVANSYNTGKVNGDNCVSGVVGTSQTGTIINCYNTGEVSGTSYVGGIVGESYSATIANCYNTGTVYGNYYFGAIFGYGRNYDASNCYYLDSSCSFGTGDDSVYGPITSKAKTSAEFASGEVAYLLQSEQTEAVWGQKIGTDEIPVLGGDKVYTVTDCKGEVAGYNNTGNETLDHNFVNGFCVFCDAFEPATDENEDGVYEIGNAGQLYWFADKVNNDNANFGSADAILTADIVVNEGVMTAESEGARVWTPIGNNNNKYTGTFDGNGKTVSGLYCEMSDSKFVGFFGYAGEGSEIKNIGVINSYFNGGTRVGSVAGVTYGLIDNSYSTSDVNGSGGVGGVAGFNHGTITNCYNTGTVSGGSQIGGMIGTNYSIINNCYNTGTVNSSEFAGGIVGIVESGSVSDCYNTGAVTNSRGYSGGVAAFINGTITNCYYLNTAYSGGINSSDSSGSAEAKTAEQFKSGEVAYLLQGTQTEEIWGQKIGTDTYPVLGGDKVYYGYTSCAYDAEMVYTNTEVSDERPAHKELRAEFDWNTPYDGECYVYVELYCIDCGGYVASDSDYATIKETVEAQDCMHPGSELYEVSFEYKGVTYTDTKSFALKSDNHVGELENGFCTECGGYEPAKLNDNGTPDDEWDDYYEISNAGQLYWFAEHATNDQYSKAVLTDDIIVNEDMNSENLREWISIGESSSMPYCGSFDGQGHFISGLYAKSELNYIGLFGAIGWGASISNLGIKDSYFEGNYYVGGIVGYNDFSYIKNCYAEDVEVVAVSSGGALVGYNYGEVSNSYSTTDSFVGNNNYGTITNCYYLAEEETDYIDGTTAKTADAFASGEVAYLLQAGVVGEEIWDDELGDYVQTEPEEIWGQKIGTDEFPSLGGDKVYYGYVSCAEDATAVYTNDKNATDEKPDHNFVNGFCTVGGEFESATLNSQGFYEISNAGQLYWFADKVNNDYANFKSVKVILTDNIVVNEGVISADSKNVREWIPIGTSISKRFAGVFYGNNKTISGLYCNNEDYDIAGLFGYSEATIAGVGVINSYFSGASVAGSIAGCYIGGRKIENCYSTSIVNAANAGGIVGHTFAVVKVQNCYFTGEVTGTNVGGIVGYFEEDFTGTITNCYYLSTVCSGGINGSDLKGSAEAKTIEQFKSGEVAYLLQGEQSQEIWGQEIGTDTYPVFGGDKVYYGYTSCADDVMVYTNNEDVSDKKLSHDWNNGVCSGCNKVCEHNFEKGFCTVCGAMDGIAQVKGYTISLKENIAVNYYMVLADEVIADENAKMVFTVPNGTKSNPNNTEIVEIAVKDITPTNDGYYVFTCEVAAKEMASVIKAQIIMSDGTASNVFEYTVKEYAEHMLANPDTYAKEQALVKAMLNYGASAQVYFNYNADNLANNTKYMSDEEKVVNLYGFAGAGYTLEGEEAGVKYYGTALSLESELAFKHYFIIDSSVNVDELTIDCKYDAKLKKSGNLYELKISGIPAHQVATDVTVKLGNTSLTYSIASYGELIQNNGDTALWTVVSALTDYSFEASLYANK